MNSPIRGESFSTRPFRFRLWISFLLGLLASAVAAAQTTYEVVHAFRNSGQPSGLIDTVDEHYGATQSALIQASDGYLYGTSYWGGTNGIGTIFRIDAAGQLTTVHSFTYGEGSNPAASLVETTDGRLYGTATRGGAGNLGTVFRMDFTGAVQRVHSFNGADGKDPRGALIQASDGALYGTTYSGGAHDDGTVFKLDTSGVLTTVHHFDHATYECNPAAALLQASDGNFYGTTEGGWESPSTVFRIDASGTLSTVHVFDYFSGYRPYAPLIQASDGNLYGTTSRGGAAGLGTVFRIGMSGDFALLHSFDPNVDGAQPYAALIQTADGSFYGTTSRGTWADWSPGTIYRFDSSGHFEVIHQFDGTDGWSSETALVQASDGNFYGTTTSAMRCVANSCSPVAGSAFQMDASNELKTVHTFGWADGAEPRSALTEAADGSFYGSTNGGGTSNKGTIFRFMPSGEVITIHSFDGTDGAYPQRIVPASDGFAYGTCLGGGKGNGSFFRLANSGALTTLHVFDGVINGFPTGVILAADGSFYGTTVGGGEHGWGSIFRLTSNGDFTQLWSFDPSVDGGSPSCLIETTPGYFFGTTITSLEGMGVLYEFNGSVYVLHEFQYDDGSAPATGVVAVPGDSVRGTTMEGGAFGEGTIFEYSYEFATIHNFEGCAEPISGLGAAADSAVYGTNYCGIYRLDAQNNYSYVHVFGGFDTRAPAASLIQGSDGNMYGVAEAGVFGGGILYRISNATVAVNELSPDSGPSGEEVAVDVLGGGFANDAEIEVGGAAATDVTVLDTTLLYLRTPALAPGTLNDVTVTVPNGVATATATKANAFFADFLDVPQIDPFHDSVEQVVRHGVTAGCGGGNYCPTDAVTRAQMAVFLLKSKHGAAYIPPLCQGSFDDVTCPSLFADWIERLAAEGITAGCGGGNYCPASPVTRAQMAAFLLKTKHGPAFDPPDCTNLFLDVPCPSLFADWIEELAAEQITAGCGGGSYCPDNPNTRAQMSAFLVKTFGF